MDTQELLQEVITRYINEELIEWNYIELNGHRFGVKIITG